MTSTFEVHDSPGNGSPVSVTAYLEEVRGHMDGLDSEEVEELLDDIALGLGELDRESQEDLAVLLGEPAAFAAELMESAGLIPAPEGNPGPTLGQYLRRLRRRVRHSVWYREVAGFLPELRPAWWVLRGWVLVTMVLVLAGERITEVLPVPEPAGNGLLGLVVLAIAVVFSVRRGRAAVGRKRGRGRRLVEILVGTVSAIWVLAVLASVQSPDPFEGPVDLFEQGLAYPYQFLPANLYAYLPDGTELPAVLLYDQEGRPVELPRAHTDPVRGWDYQSLTPVDSRGRQVPNIYPRPLEVLRPTNGSWTRVTVPPPLVAVPKIDLGGEPGEPAAGSGNGDAGTAVPGVDAGPEPGSSGTTTAVPGIEERIPSLERPQDPPGDETAP